MQLYSKMIHTTDEIESPVIQRLSSTISSEPVHSTSAYRQLQTISTRNCLAASLSVLSSCLAATSSSSSSLSSWNISRYNHHFQFSLRSYFIGNHFNFLMFLPDFIFLLGIFPTTKNNFPRISNWIVLFLSIYHHEILEKVLNMSRALTVAISYWVLFRRIIQCFYRLTNRGSLIDILVNLILYLLVALIWCKEEGKREDNKKERKKEVLEERRNRYVVA